MTGIVKRLALNKNFGFIVTLEKIEYFFHRDDFSGHWPDLALDIHNNKKIEVEFVPTSSTKGPRAEEVKRTDWPN